MNFYPIIFFFHRKVQAVPSADATHTVYRFASIPFFIRIRLGFDHNFLYGKDLKDRINPEKKTSLKQFLIVFLRNCRNCPTAARKTVDLKFTTNLFFPGQGRISFVSTI